MHVKRSVLTGLVLSLAGGVAAAELPKPTFHIGFDGTAVPAVAAGAKEHPSLKTEGLAFVEGRKGKGLLLGKTATLVYQVGGNIPDEATVAFWIKPVDWQTIDKWRYLVSVSPHGRSYMIFAQYPKKKPVIQYIFTPQSNPNHEATERELRVNEWNHVAIAWDGLRSR